MIKDLKHRGYKYATLGVEPTELKNKAIYQKYGFTEHLEDSKEIYPDGTIVEVEYYRKKLQYFAIIKKEGESLTTITTSTPKGKSLITTDMYYDITCEEKDLDLVFLVAFSIAKTEQIFYN